MNIYSDGHQILKYNPIYAFSNSVQAIYSWNMTFMVKTNAKGYFTIGLLLVWSEQDSISRHTIWFFGSWVLFFEDCLFLLGYI